LVYRGYVGVGGAIGGKVNPVLTAAEGRSFSSRSPNRARRMNQHSRARSGGIPRLRPQAIPVLSYGFRPFFFSAALWAAVAMVLWLGLLSGWWTFANGYGAIAWHAHEFLFGYIAAVMTGFLLTAIPNWTGRLPLQGMPLLVLLVLWLAGRAAMLATDQIGTSAATLIDCAYLVTLTAIITREIVAGSNWRNLRVAVLVALTAVANIVFQAEVLIHARPNYGLRLAVAAIVALIMVIGGRVTPSFTSNWLTRQGSQTRPAPMGRFDIGAIAIGAIALAVWIAAPDWYGAAALLVVMAIAHAARLSRWAGARTWREPMLFVLHLGYAFVPLGALLLSTSIVWPRIVPASGALHAWTTGAMGIAIMTRATLGHTGRDVLSTPATITIYGAMLLAALARIAAPMLPVIYYEALLTAAFGWLLAFGIFLLLYGPMLLGRQLNSSLRR
jgi:uncharacterized protein involved in response to NO